MLPGFKQIFKAFGPSAIGQAIAAVVIGALSGLFAAFEDFKSVGSPVLICTAGGALLGFVAALVLLVADYHRRRVRTGTSKPLSATAWVIGTFVAIAAIIAAMICIATVMH
jgi:hypothetical protein